jgi:hypothetical protein
MSLALALNAGGLTAQVLDAHAIIGRQTYMDNRDVDWFARRIPIFESPDGAIDSTYYYRWDLITKHLTYGSPRSGYTFTEFIDRPFWSGAYGAISCPLGHQLAEMRWLKDRRIIEDFARYWFETPGAQPRSYSNWYGSAMWGIFEVRADTGFLRRVLPYMKAQYAGWVTEHFDSTQQMFRWDGLHDGMERNINSRQTTDIDAGAEGYRPTLNAYLYGDARAIARASALLGDTNTARAFDARADALRSRVEHALWDERREFFLHQFAHDEPDGVRALTRTYETGKYADDSHGRELIGYVPWQFDLPEAGKGYERAWRFLMDTSYFLAPFGPATTERHDPQFTVSPRCCWWSGNSWPYATTQTLTAMANLLNDYRQNVVNARDWMRVFESYTRTQRKNGAPYVAEGANPFTGSWDGFDTPYHSEHYFHSAYVDLVITGVVGLRPRADDSAEVNPLAPAEWSYFALDGVLYHGHLLSVLWDRDGKRYGKGRGLTVLVDGAVASNRRTLGRLVFPMPAVPAEADRFEPLHVYNLAVNNGRGAYPWIDASFAAPENPPTYLNDGNYWYLESPPNRWTTVGSPHTQDTITIDFGAYRRIEEMSLFILDDGDGKPVRAPLRFDVEEWRNVGWHRIASSAVPMGPAVPTGHRENRVSAHAYTPRVRVIFTPRPGSAVGLSEIEAWGPEQSLDESRQPSPDLAFNATSAGYPRALASFTSQYDRVEDVNDLRVAFTRYSRNRWTAYGTPNPTDWLEIDFDSALVVRTIELYLWGDGTGVKAPRSISVQAWRDSTWVDVEARSRQPERPLAGARNVITVAPVRTSKLRVVFEHDLPSVSGVTELIVR